jgi:hypothetical protein
MAVPAALSTIHNPAVGTIPPATWGDLIETTLEFLKAPPSVKVKLSAVQSIPSGTETLVAWNQEDWDSELIHDNASSNSRLVCKTAGKHRIWTTPVFAAAGTGVRFATLLINGIEAARSPLLVADGLTPTGLPIYFEAQLAVNDYAEVKVFQNRGSALNLETGSRFGMTWFST